MPLNIQQQYTITSADFPTVCFWKFREFFIQRESAKYLPTWNESKKAKFAEDVLCRRYVPSIVLREIILNESETCFEVIDGWQRITAIQEFNDEQFQLPESLCRIPIFKEYYDQPSEVSIGLPPKRIKCSFGGKILLANDFFTTVPADIIMGINNTRNSEHQRIATELFQKLHNL